MFFSWLNNLQSFAFPDFCGMSGFLGILQDSWLFQESYIITGLSAVYRITGLSAVYIITGLSAVYMITGLSAILFPVFFMPMIMFSFMIML